MLNIQPKYLPFKKILQAEHISPTFFSIFYTYDIYIIHSLKKSTMTYIYEAKTHNLVFADRFQSINIY